MRAFGKYRLIEPIASGGMAEVWRAEAPGAAGFVKEVALKLIRGDHDASGDFVEMFIREARLASRLAHGNIVQVFEFDQIEGRYYIAMELVHGRTLRAVVDRCRAAGVRFGLARAVHVGAEVARALAYAHRSDHGGLVHRDVSPQNVLLSFEGEVKLADFGIARVLGAADVTAPGTVKGKLAYMPPEQARGTAVDGRADIFSLGVILWELCTGRRLFARDSDAATLAAVMANDPIVPPSTWNEAVPPELDAIVAGALARDPERRTPSAEVLATSLAAARLRLATSPEDIDLRTLLARLWPDRDAPGGAPSGAHTEVRRGADPGPERTAARGATPVLPVPVASEGGITPPEREAPPEPPQRAVPPEPPPLAEVLTRTGVAAARGRERWRVLRGGVAIIAVAVTLVAGARLWARRVPPGRPRAPAPAPAAVVTNVGPPTVKQVGPRTEQVPPVVKQDIAPPVPAPVLEPKAPPHPAPAMATKVSPVPAPVMQPTAPPAPVPAAEAATRGPPPAAKSVATRGPASSTTEHRVRPPAIAAPVPLRAPARAPPRVAEAAADPVGTASVSVRALPWAFVWLDGEELGETPYEGTVRAGSHRIRVHHPTLGDDEIVVTLRPGERYAWRPRLSRP